MAIECGARAYYGSMRAKPSFGVKGSRSGGQSPLKQRAFVKFSIQLFNFLPGIYSFNFSYKSFAEDQKNILKLACKAEQYSLPVKGKQRSTIENRNADER